MDLLGSFFGGSNSLVDGAKLVLIGGTIETARRVGQSAWSSFLSSFYLTAHFSEDDYPWDWLQYWLQRQPQWRSSREFETTTRTTTVGLSSGKEHETQGDEFTEDNDPEDELQPGKQKMSVVFVPTFDSTIGIYYKKHWLRVRRWKANSGQTEMLSISVVARNNAVLKQLVLEAKKLYEADAEHRVNIYFADSHGSWRWTDSRSKRPLSSIVLNKGVKEMLLDDARDFLKSEKWYSTRGIPFRRGYLLHGVPGSGKTSLIHALAGALALDIYVVSLSASWINDATLSTLMGRVPARCIVLLEDLDAAFTRSSSRDDDNSTGIPSGSKGTTDLDDPWGSSGRNDHGSSFGRRRNFVPDYNTLSLSGLLNSLDGVSAPEGRLLFATTNHLDRLDPALTRPGRMDVWVEFQNASQWQAELLFTNFFLEVEDENEKLAAAAAAAAGPSKEEIAAMEKEFAFLAEQQRLEAQSGVSIKQAVAGSAPTGSSESEKLVPTDGSIPSNLAGVEAMAAACELGLPSPPVLTEKPIVPLDPAHVAKLARVFATAIPDREHSVASLQGYLLRNKSRPEAAVAEAAAWVQSERDLRTRLKREREDRDAKMSIERDKRRKEREEAKRRADRDEMRREREEQSRIRREDEEWKASELAEEKKRIEEKAAAAAGTTVAAATATATDTDTPATATAAEPTVSPVTTAPATPETSTAAVVDTPVSVTESTSAAVVVATHPPALDAKPEPSSAPVDKTSESDSEVDGQHPGAASIVLVRPETVAPVEDTSVAVTA